MDKSLAQFVWTRAGARCEYCQLEQAHSALTFEIDHIIAIVHDGETVAENLALSCFYCNSFKGPNLAGLDAQTGKLTRLFHPRSDVWSEHFSWNAAVLVGRTEVGRTTIRVLRINEPQAVALRRSILDEPS